jgi:hypothetical protein
MGDNILRLESVEFEDWGASRICGKFDGVPRTFLYGDDSDALCEILRAIRRGLGLVEEALERRLSAVGKRRVRGLERESDWRQVRRRPANASGTRFAKSSACFVAGSESSKKRWSDGDGFKRRLGATFHFAYCCSLRLEAKPGEFEERIKRDGCEVRELAEPETKAAAFCSTARRLSFFPQKRAKIWAIVDGAPVRSIGAQQARARQN